MKKFEFNKYNETDERYAQENRSGIYDRTEITKVEFSLCPFQGSPNGRKGFGEPARLNFSFIVDKDPDTSGVVDDFQVQIKSFDGYSQIFKLGEIEPEELFWIGKLLLKVAKHYGITMKQQIKENKKKK